MDLDTGKKVDLDTEKNVDTAVIDTFDETKSEAEVKRVKRRGVGEQGWGSGFCERWPGQKKMDRVRKNER